MTKAGLLLNLPPIKNKAYSSKRSDNARTHALGKALESVATGWPVYSIRDAFQPLVKPDALDTAAFGQNRHYAPDRLLGGIFLIVLGIYFTRHLISRQVDTILYLLV